MEKRPPYQDEQFQMVSTGNQQSLDFVGVADESVTQLTSSETFARDLLLVQEKMEVSLFQLVQFFLIHCVHQINQDSMLASTFFEIKRNQTERYQMLIEHWE